MTIRIQTPKTISAFRSIEWLQTEIWGSVADTVPAHLLLTIAKEGGIVLLALDDDDPVGFAYGFLSLTADGQLKLASHQAGVLPAYQSQGLGYRLKLAQREAALAKDLALITWTYDPLQGLNGRLNLHKLGAVCSTYIPNLYGEMSDELNQGLPSDRFRVDWWLTSPHVTERLADQTTAPDPENYPILNPAAPIEDDADDLYAPPETVDLPAGQPACLVEIPPDLARLKETAPDLALRWRLQTRRIFQTAFEQGYSAVDLLRREGRSYYLLDRMFLPLGNYQK